MTLISLGTIVLSVTLSAIGQVCFKLGLNSLNLSGASHGPVQSLALTLLTPEVMAGLGFYGLGTLLWLSALDRVELSQAYPFVSLGFALTTVCGWWLFNDQVSLQRVIGIAVVMAGIVLVARS